MNKRGSNICQVFLNTYYAIFPCIRICFSFLREKDTGDDNSIDIDISVLFFFSIVLTDVNVYKE
jgi:hypothetical protein